MSSQAVKSNKNQVDKKSAVKKPVASKSTKQKKDGVKKRTFKYYDIETGTSNGRYTNPNPKQAARKAFKQHHQKLKKMKEAGELKGEVPKKFTFYIKESGQQSNKKFYAYTGVVEKLKKPLVREIPDKDGNITKVTYLHKYDVTKAPLPDNLRELQEAYIQKKKDKKKKEERKKKREENKKEGNMKKPSTTKKPATTKKPSTTKKPATTKKPSPAKKTKPVTKKQPKK